MNATRTGAPVVPGAADSRSVGLDRLADTASRTATENLKRVIPDSGAAPVAVAAFASSI